MSLTFKSVLEKIFTLKMLCSFLYRDWFCKKSITDLQFLFQLCAGHIPLFFATPKLALIGFDCYLPIHNEASVTNISMQQIFLELLLRKFRISHSYQENNTFPSAVILFISFLTNLHFDPPLSSFSLCDTTTL